MIPVIVGPTSSGKTSLAIQIAKHFNGELISADSRQIYKHMDIGTGKIPVKSDLSVKNFVNYWTLDDVVVWGYDLTEPNNYFSAFDYFTWANKTLADIQQGRDKNPILVGGTGFYIDLVTGRKGFSNVPPNFGLRQELESESLENLQIRLLEIAPDAYAQIDTNNPARLIRAIEISLTANNLSSDKQPPKLNTFFIGLTSSRETLYNRADAWVEVVWNNGLVGEVNHLLEMGFKDSLPLNGIVYKTVLSYLKDEISETDCLQRIKFDLHSYIRRQQTWFKQNKDIVWFDISEQNFFQKVLDHVQSKIDG